MTEDPLGLLMNRITLERIPFTERGSRLLVFRAADGGLWVGLAEYETRPAAPWPCCALDTSPVPG